MMMMYPGMYYPVYGAMMPEQMYGQHGGKSYGIFIRKAVDSEDEEPEVPVKKEAV